MPLNYSKLSQLFDCLNDLGHHFKRIAYNAVICGFEEGRLWIFVDHNYGLAAVYSC